MLYNMSNFPDGFCLERFIDVFDEGLKKIEIAEIGLPKHAAFMALFVVYQTSHKIYQENIDLFLMHSSRMIEVIFEILKLEGGGKIIKKSFEPVMDFEKEQEPENVLEYICAFLSLFLERMKRMYDKEAAVEEMFKVVKNTKYNSEIRNHVLTQVLKRRIKK